MYHLIYVNSKLRECHKLFKTKQEAFEFIAVLDKRIQKGTCFGYTLTKIQ